MSSILHKATSQGKKVLSTLHEICFQQYKVNMSDVVQPKSENMVLQLWISPSTHFMLYV